MTSISTLWAVLNKDVRQWLRKNPGTMVLPRTYVNMVEAEAGQVLQLDAHGEYWLSPEDMLFLRSRRHDASDCVSTRSDQLVSAVDASTSGRLDIDPHAHALDQ